ncbi:MAG: sensor histidine kinase N-terminal domain-containing protein [Steroidobacteraceae bacterium]
MVGANPRPRSLRSLLLRSILAVTTLAWLAAAVATWVDTSREVDTLLDAHLAQSARLLIAQSAHEIAEVDVEDLRELAPYGQQVAFQVWDDQGKLVLHSADAPAGARFSASLEGFSDATVAGEPWRVYSGRDRRGLTLVQVAERHGVRDRITRKVVLNTLVPLLLTLPLLALVLGWRVRRALQPLEQLGHEVAARDPQALAPLPGEAVPEEAAPLVARLNALFERVGHSLEQERRFTANAAHELRNPLAALRAQAEVARASRDPARSAAALDQVIVACDRLARLVDQLLLLARVESVAPSRESVALADLARDTVAELAPGAIRAGHDLGLVVDAPASVQGNRALLAALLRNLVDNALRHGVAGTTAGADAAAPPPPSRAIGVTVRVAQAAGVATLEVEDDGVGVAPGELARLGEYFERPAGTSAAGSGLGLALARRIAEVHGGRLAFAPGSGGRGLRVTLTMPVS